MRDRRLGLMLQPLDLIFKVQFLAFQLINLDVVCCWMIFLVKYRFLNRLMTTHQLVEMRILSTWEPLLWLTTTKL